MLRTKCADEGASLNTFPVFEFIPLIIAKAEHGGPHSKVILFQTLRFYFFLVEIFLPKLYLTNQLHLLLADHQVQ